VFEFSLSRREALGTIAAASALPAVSAFAAPAAEAQAKTLLDSFAEHMLDLFPESATSMGLDTRRRDPLRSRLSDRSASGQQRVRQTIAADLQRAEQLDLSTLSFATRTSVEVVKSAYRTALERQLQELQAQRAVATSDPGIAARPRGDEFYRWALEASTTTTMSPSAATATRPMS
jgi:uncharacterized protein (DUF885 family)